MRYGLSDSGHQKDTISLGKKLWFHQLGKNLCSEGMRWSLDPVKTPTREEPFLGWGMAQWAKSIASSLPCKAWRCHGHQTATASWRDVDKLGSVRSGWWGEVWPKSNPDCNTTILTNSNTGNNTAKMASEGLGVTVAGRIQEVSLLGSTLKETNSLWVWAFELRLARMMSWQLWTISGLATCLWIPVASEQQGGECAFLPCLWASRVAPGGPLWEICQYTCLGGGILVCSSGAFLMLFCLLGISLTILNWS